MNHIILLFYYLYYLIIIIIILIIIILIIILIKMHTQSLSCKVFYQIKYLIFVTQIF